MSAAVIARLHLIQEEAKVYNALVERERSWREKSDNGSTNWLSRHWCPNCT
ncbi:20257_t:CDS:2 [Funneliformis geosporum]|uniref:3251_t:CDS:1 n=1 Tax=Funneliformis geosporum TaxID=1117311 RepID=A0A9W4WW57_9GLOM|nr:20257_t:CDS:2 [Funneliformis geosporum]CAI2176617.1 3251_t:CDS:2 [Funneliformis geosporum]